MRFTLFTTSPLILLLPPALVSARFTQLSADDARIQYWHPLSTEKPTRQMCTDNPQYCRNMWWHEPSTPAAYTTMGPASTLTFDFTGAEGITVYGNHDPSVHPTASLNGVNYAPSSGSRTLFSTDKLNPGEKYTLTLTYASDLTQTLVSAGLSGAVMPDGFLVISEIVLDRPEEPTTTTAVPVPTFKAPIQNFESQNTTLASSMSTTSNTTVASSTSHTAFGVTPNFAPASSAQAATSGSPTTAEATASVLVPARPKSQQEHLRNLILPIVLIVVTPLALLAGYAFWRWRRRRRESSGSWETRIISAYEPATPSWRLPIQMPRKGDSISDESSSRRQLVVSSPYYQGSDFSSSTVTSRSQTVRPTWSYI